MASEVTILREGSVKTLNAERGSVRRATAERTFYKQRVKQQRASYIHSEEFPTSKSDRIKYKNLYTGKLTKSSSAKKEFLNHAETLNALEAAKEAWNNPSALKRVRKSPLGEGKSMSNPEHVKNIEKKKKRNITNFNIYRMDYGGRSWTIKTAQYKKGYETLYYIG